MHPSDPSPAALLGVVLLAAGAYLAGDLGTRYLRRVLIGLGIIDIPTSRSSHGCPTPRGGGIVLVAIGIAATIASCLLGWMPERTCLALVGGGLLVALVGWLDDTRGLRWRHRLLAQFAAAAWALFWLGGFPALELGLARIDIGALGLPLALLGIVWGINFFNFMDGIDGIAASQAAFVGLVGGGLLLVDGRLGLAAVALAVASASGGFLRHNWMPARIFLGDVGSTWLGYTLCVLGVASSNLGAVPMVAWGILLGVFVFDATLTLVRRVRHGHPVHAAHREHAFCRATRWGWTHARVTSGVLVLDGILAALAVTAWAWPSFLLPAAGLGLALVAFAYQWVEARFPMAGDTVAAIPVPLLLEHTGPDRRLAAPGTGALPRPAAVDPPQARHAS